MSFTDQNFTSQLRSQIDKQKPDHSLDQIFYTDSEIFKNELEKLIFNDWIYICHTSQIPNVGDSYTFDIVNESVIVCRDESNQINAYVNVCRHRGSQICEKGSSNQKKFICPYHAWTYSLKGELLSARQMPEHFDKSTSSLKSLSIEVFFGLVFVSFSEAPVSFEPLRKNLKKPLDVFEINNTRVAHYACHKIDANWKLVFENFNECYHCGPAHKEFSASHSLMLSEHRQVEYQLELQQRAIDAGISPDPIGLSQCDPQTKDTAPYYYDRYALFSGYATGSEDGKPVAPLLGSVKKYDGGASNVQLGNLTYLLIYADHIVLYRFIPKSVCSTDAELLWLVRSDAEKSDVDIERMTWLWNVTTRADKNIIERNQKGVLSRYYQPGPYAPMEIYTIGFIKWYLERMYD